MRRVLQKSCKIFLYLVVILQYPLNKDDQEIAKLIKFYEDDKNFCPQCFQETFNECIDIDNEIEFSEDFLGSLNNLFGEKQIKYGTLKGNDSKKIVIKYLASAEKFNYVLGAFCKDAETSSCAHISESEQSYKILRETFFNRSRIDGCQFCPVESVQKFIQNINIGQTEFSTWIHLNINFQPILLPILNQHDFPVPTFYRSCGFTIYESFEGLTLNHYYSSRFDLKIKIALEILLAGLKFTEGFKGYKLYLTDITADNIVYDQRSNKISFIDLDHIIVVDSQYKLKGNVNVTHSDDWETIHKHEIIDCDGCFAYVPSEICSHHLSDLNLYAICQFLREDLYGDISKGFLYPIPENIIAQYPQFTHLLDACIKCDKDCVNRFKTFHQLVQIIKEIIS